MRRPARRLRPEVRRGDYEALAAMGEERSAEALRAYERGRGRLGGPREGASVEKVEGAPRCGGCAWWDPDGAPGRGRCRVRPPEVVPTGLVGAVNGEGRHVNLGTMWPMTRESDWCGEWREAWR